MEGKSVGFGTIVQLVVLILGLGVAYGGLKSEVDGLKRTQQELAAVQTAILEKLERIDRRIGNVEGAVQLERRRQQR